MNKNNSAFSRPRYSFSSEDSNSTMSVSAGNSPSQIVPHINNMSIYNTGPQLILTNQPIEKFRFRYESEMAATHGTLFGRDQKYSKKLSCPTVEVRGYNGECIVTCLLVQNETNSIRLHPHHLISRNSNDDADTENPVTCKLGPEEGYLAKFQGLSIVHTFKKQVANVLFEKCKKQKLYSPVISDFANWQKSDNELMSECCNEAKNINLNSVRLCFFAYDMLNQPICAPVMSHPIDNIKSTEAGTLRINRISKVCGSPGGDEEVFIFVEKVSKKNIKVRFFEEDEYGNRVWEAFAKFNELDVHHQYAIVFMTPPYKNKDIQNDVVVHMELYRPKDEAVSERRTFRYKAHRTPPRKRKFDDQSYNDFSYVELPETISNFNANKNDNSQQQLNDENAKLSSMELSTLIQSSLDEIDTDLLHNTIGSIELEDYLNMFGNEETSTFKLLEADSAKKLVSKPDETKKIHFKPDKLKALKMYSYLISKNASSSSNSEKILLNLMGQRFEDNDNILHFLIKSNNTKRMPYVLNLIQSNKLHKLLDETNNSGETILHTVIRNHHSKLIKYILEAGANPNMCDDNGDSPLHLSVILRDFKCFTEILNYHESTAESKLDIDKYNSDGWSPLHLAVMNGLAVFASQLINVGANSQLKCEKNGQTPLYLAVKYSYPPLVSSLLQYEKMDVNVTTFDGYTPLHAVCVMNDANSISICKSLLNAGADVNSKCSQGYPLDLAMKNENTKIAELLNARKAKYETSINESKDTNIEECEELDIKTFDSLSKLLNERDVWKAVAKELKLNEVLTVCLGSEHPGEVLLNNIEFNENITWTSLLAVLKKLNEKEAWRVLSDFLKKPR